jgi:hypothetical protein
MVMNVEQSLEWQLAGEIVVLGGNVSQCDCAPQVSHALTWNRTLVRQ